MLFANAEVAEICQSCVPEDAFRALAHLPHCLFLDSAMRHPMLGRYSFIAADPFRWIEAPADGSDALGRLAAELTPFQCETVPGLPPFQGGAAGLLGYELRHSLERLPEARCNELNMPALAVGLYDVVVAFDHVADKAWIISQGWPETDPGKRQRRARERLEWMRSTLGSATDRRLGDANGRSGSPHPQPLSRKRERGDDEYAARFAVRGFPRLESNFSREGYLAAVQRVIDYIYAGDVFQVNLAQELSLPADEDPVSLYLRLRRANPAPFAGYFDLGDRQIISASPERFLHIQNGCVETRPIKGTRRRSGDAAADAAAREELGQSDKDRAENVMIVDLLRNDLSRVCRPESVRVSQLCDVEDYEHVMHLVSAVRGELAEGRDAIDLVRAAFPGGSITGAPKIRAMEIIAELEPTARGAYCGSLGYIGGNGTMDLNILIRTITAAADTWHFSVGGGIVAQSNPAREYEETWEKAAGLLRAIYRGDDKAIQKERGEGGKEGKE